MRGDKYWNAELIRILKHWQKQAKGVLELHKVYQDTTRGFGYIPYDYRQKEDRAYRLAKDVVIVDDYSINDLKIDFDECCVQCGVAVIEGDE